MDQVEDAIEGDRGGEPASNRVVYTVAAYANRTVDDLPPLYWSLEPDALDALVDTMERGSITFEYADHEVTVDAEGSVTAVPLGD